MLEQRLPTGEHVDHEPSGLQLLLQNLIVRPVLHRPRGACDRSNGDIARDVRCSALWQQVFLAPELETKPFEDQVLVAPPVGKLELVRLRSAVDADETQVEPSARIGRVLHLSALVQERTEQASVPRLSDKRSCFGLILQVDGKVVVGIEGQRSIVP